MAEKYDPMLHPLYCLAHWDMTWRDALDHDDPPGRVTIESAAEYLSRQMPYMAEQEHPSFADFAADLRRCRAHLETVLHDQAQGDVANIGCFECGSRLERKVTPHGLDDAWTCQRCRRRYTHPEYLFALRAALESATKETA